MKLEPLAEQGASAAAWAALHAQACAPYRGASHWAWHWARGKLRHDPVFRGMLERGEIAPRSHVVDIGCGQGLLASLLHACATLQRSGQWPQSWPVQASCASYTGIELMPQEVARARAALHGHGFAPSFVCADMCHAALPPCDLVVILDVMHYVDHDAQAALLARVRGALRHARGRPGRLLMRVGDAADRRGYTVSQWVDRVVTLARGHRVPPTWGRTLEQWMLLLQGMGFAVRAVPQSQGTPFANVLLVADLAEDGGP